MSDIATLRLIKFCQDHEKGHGIPHHQGWALISHGLFATVRDLPTDLVELFPLVEDPYYGGWVRLTPAGETIVKYTKELTHE